MAVQTTPFRRSTIATYKDINAALAYAAVDQLRNQHYQGGVLQPPLIEDRALNTALWSEDWSNAIYAKANVAVTPNGATAPDGAATADILARTSTTLNAQVTQTQGLIAGGTVLGLSVFAKANTVGNRIGIRWQTAYPVRADAVFDLAAGTIVGTNANGYTNLLAKIEGFINSWYRVSLLATVPANNATTFLLIVPTDSSRSVGSFEGFTASLADCQIWGTMAQVGGVTSYFPTAGAAAAREADIDQMFGATDVAFTRQIGSWIAEGFTPDMQVTPAGYADNSVAVVRDVSPLILGIAGVRTIEPAVPGRSLTGATLAYVPSVPTGGTMPSRGIMRGARTKATRSISQHSSLGTKRRKEISKRLHEAGVAEDPAEEQPAAARADAPDLVLEQEAPAPIAIARPLGIADLEEQPAAAPAAAIAEPDTTMLRQMMLAAPTVAPLSEDESWLDDLPSVIAAIDEDDLLRGTVPQAIKSR